MDENLYSACCGASSSCELEDVEGELIGMCAECKEWTHFMDDDEYMDWEDELEYIREHL